MQRTHDQNNQFHLLLGLCEYDTEQKRELVAKCTGLRTVHSAEMEIEEMAAAIRELKRQRRELLSRYMRVIGLCCAALGWTKLDGRGMTMINFNSLNGYVKTHYHKETVYRMSAHQLNKLVISLKQIALHKGVKL